MLSNTEQRILYFITSSTAVTITKTISQLVQNPQINLLINRFDTVIHTVHFYILIYKQKIQNELYSACFTDITDVCQYNL